MDLVVKLVKVLTQHVKDMDLSPTLFQCFPVNHTAVKRKEKNIFIILITTERANALQWVFLSTSMVQLCEALG